MDKPGLRSVAFDLGGLVRRNVASLYSSLVTRPTGQAVREAIEAVLREQERGVSLSVVDFSEVSVLDFSCADEVVAKLLLRFLDEDRPGETFFVFTGLGRRHRGPVEVVLQRHALAAVAQTPEGRYELLGTATECEHEAWRELETRGRASPGELAGALGRDDAQEAVDSLVRRRLAFLNPRTQDLHALSDLVRALT